MGIGDEIGVMPDRFTAPTHGSPIDLTHSLTHSLIYRIDRLPRSGKGENVGEREGRRKHHHPNEMKGNGLGMMDTTSNRFQADTNRNWKREVG